MLSQAYDVRFAVCVRNEEKATPEQLAAHLPQWAAGGTSCAMVAACIQTAASGHMGQAHQGQPLSFLGN